jgi:hypothetical protein
MCRVTHLPCRREKQKKSVIPDWVCTFSIERSQTQRAETASNDPNDPNDS